MDPRCRFASLQTPYCADVRDTISHPELVSGSVRGHGVIEARGEMLKQVQHDVEGIELAHKVILNLFQDLSAVKEKQRLAVRC